MLVELSGSDCGGNGEGSHFRLGPFFGVRGKIWLREVGDEISDTGRWEGVEMNGVRDKGER